MYRNNYGCEAMGIGISFPPPTTVANHSRAGKLWQKPSDKKGSQEEEQEEEEEDYRHRIHGHNPWTRSWDRLSGPLLAILSRWIGWDRKPRFTRFAISISGLASFKTLLMFSKICCMMINTLAFFRGNFEIRFLNPLNQPKLKLKLNFCLTSKIIQLFII